MMRQDVQDPFTFHAEPTYLKTYVESNGQAYDVTAMAWNGDGDLVSVVLATALPLSQALAVAQVPS